MTDCKLCGQPLTKGNIKVVRPKGKKRPYRVCRTCPQVRSEAIQPTALEDFVTQVPKVRGETAGDGVQWPQDSTGALSWSKGYSTIRQPIAYRYFITRDQAERVKASTERNVVFGLGIAFEVIPVPKGQVDQEPDRFADLVEVTISGYNGDNE